MKISDKSSSAPESAENKLAELFKKNFRRKRKLLSGANLLMTLILIPLLKLLDGTDYSLLWRTVMVAATVTLFIQNLRQNSCMKKQLAALSEHTLECVFSELESCPCFRNSFYFTSDYLFSTEGMILPYYEITEVLTRSYVSTGVGFVTNLVIKTRSYGRCVVPVGIGHLYESFYDTLGQKCPNAKISFRATYQKATRQEYFDTIKADSINVIRKKSKQEDK